MFVPERRSRVNAPQSADRPTRIDITPANVNDVEIARTVAIVPGATYVFDKAYCDYAWWQQMHAAGAVFVTRPKTNARYVVTRRRAVRKTAGDGFRVIDDADVALATEGKRRLDVPMRRVRVRRDDGGMLTIVTNDRTRTAIEIAALYKARWQIELLFRWIKQHLNLARFLGRSENAIRLQIIAAMIAFLLLRIAARESRTALPALRFAELARECLFVRKALPHLDRPPDVNPSRPLDRRNTNQLELLCA